jgi:G2/mitotic-specific cyclin 3/4
MLAVGGLKAAAKRTAFGDVSNTRPLATIHDDSVLDGKKDVVKPLSLADKSSFLRPAQRPLGVSNKSSVNIILGNENNKDESVVSKPVEATRPRTADTKLVAAPAPKRALSKRSTAIFKDADNEHVEVATSVDEQSAPVVPVHQNLGPRHHKSQPQLKIEQQVIRRTQSKYLINQAEQSSSEQSDPIYENAEEQVASATESYTSEDVAVAEQLKEEMDRETRQLPAPPLVSEPEEYWEDEEEEIYDEQGYTTAHSYRSRGDNTTGGATTVLFPKITNKVKKELAAATEFVETTRTKEEVEDEAWDTSMVAEYGDEIFAYMRELEVNSPSPRQRVVVHVSCNPLTANAALFTTPVLFTFGKHVLTTSQIKMLPNAHYMDLQTEIQWSMRSVLMDWLIQVHHRFSLLPETLFLTTNYIDRFLSCKIVSLGKLQLVGATAIFVAAKYEEINCPSVSEIVYMVDGGYTVDEILKAERFMLSMLQFELGWPGPMSFLRRISKADDYDLETRTLAKYFLEVTIMDERFVGSPPSYVAAGAHCFARMMLKKGEWVSFTLY